jgi:hypothetical protein
MSNKTYLDIVAELEKGATEGPWEWSEQRELHRGRWTHLYWMVQEAGHGVNVDCTCELRDDARLIAFLRNTLPEIIGLYEAARKASVDWDHDANEMGQATADERLCDAIDALDKKAEEVS